MNGFADEELVVALEGRRVCDLPDLVKGVYVMAVISRAFYRVAGSYAVIVKALLDISVETPVAYVEGMTHATRRKSLDIWELSETVSRTPDSSLCELSSALVGLPGYNCKRNILVTNSTLNADGNHFQILENHLSRRD